jgi:hypothetical protein
VTSWTWQGWSSASAGLVRLASLAPSVAPNPPWWLAGVWTVTAADARPSWPRLRAADLRLPAGRSRFTGESILEPPSRYLRWVDHLETVLADDWESVQEVNRRCLAMGSKRLPAGRVISGCSYRVVGRCFITRIDDPGVARHELAHCAGWKHPQ